jgi:hypothetical protein
MCLQHILGESTGDTSPLHDGWEGLGLVFTEFCVGRVIDCSWRILQTMGTLIPSAVAILRTLVKGSSSTLLST